MSDIIDIQTGEIISMVWFDGERYQAQEDIDLDYIAELLGTKGKGEAQKRRHIREREEHKRQINRNT